MDAVEIRPYRSGDRSAAEEVMRRALDDIGAYFPDIRDEDGDPTVHESYYEPPGGVLLVAAVDQTVVGTVGMRPPASRMLQNLDTHGDCVGELKRMHVLPEWQGRGVGHRLLEAISTEARSVGYEEFVFTTTSLQTAAHAFYEAYGFKRFDREAVDLGGNAQFELWYYRGPVPDVASSPNTS